MNPALFIPESQGILQRNNSADWSPDLLGSAVKGWFDERSWYVNAAGYPADPSDATENAGYGRNLAPSPTWHADTAFSVAPVAAATASRGKIYIVGNGTDKSIGKNANVGYSSSATAGVVACTFSLNATTTSRAVFCLASTSGTNYAYIGTFTGSSGTRLAFAHIDSVVGSFGCYNASVAAATATMYTVMVYQSGSGHRFWWGTGTSAGAEISPTWSSTPTGYDTQWFNTYGTKPSRYSILSRVTTVGASWANANFFEAIHVEGTVTDASLASLWSYLDGRRRTYFV